MTYVDEDGNYITDYSEQSEDIITDSNNSDTADVDATQEIQENEIQDSEDKDFFKDVIKMLIQDKNSDSPDDLETTDKEKISDVDPESSPDPQNELDEEDVSSGNAIDYSGLLGDIIAKEDNMIENQDYLIAISEDNKINSTLESQSATNVLLMVVIVILLVDLLVHFIRGLF